MKYIYLLIQCYVFSLLTACTQKEASIYCLQVDEEIECPTVNEVNESVFPSEDCSGRHLKAMTFDGRQETASSWADDTATDAAYDRCCFTTEYTTFAGGSQCVE